MRSIQILSVLLKDVQLTYTEDKIIVYCKSSIYLKESLKLLYSKCIMQEVIPIKIGDQSFFSRIISLSCAAPIDPKEFIHKKNIVEKLQCGDEFTITLENNRFYA